MTERLYAERDHEAQGNTYIKHVGAMTGESLHKKSDIAAELAHRDLRIAELEAQQVEALAVQAEGELELTLTRVCGGKVYGAAMRFTARQITYGPKKMLAEAAEKLQYDIERYIDFGIEKERQK